MSQLHVQTQPLHIETAGELISPSGEVLTSTRFVRWVGRESRNTVGNAKATFQREPMVTAVTPASVAALQAPPRAGYWREDTLNDAQQRQGHPARATAVKQRGVRAQARMAATAAKENSNSLLQNFTELINPRKESDREEHSCLIPCDLKMFHISEFCGKLTISTCKRGSL